MTAAFCKERRRSSYIVTHPVALVPVIGRPRYGATSIGKSQTENGMPHHFRVGHSRMASPITRPEIEFLVLSLRQNICFELPGTTPAYDSYCAAIRPALSRSSTTRAIMPVVTFACAWCFRRQGTTPGRLLASLVGFD